jgi:aspartyl/asparaginyl-tRNA synthetase
MRNRQSSSVRDLPCSVPWYRDLRRYGTVPHAGFGLGFARTLAYVTGLANVRDGIVNLTDPKAPFSGPARLSGAAQ